MRPQSERANSGLPLSRVASETLAAAAMAREGAVNLLSLSHRRSMLLLLFWSGRACALPTLPRSFSLG